MRQLDRNREIVYDDMEHAVKKKVYISKTSIIRNT